VLAKHSAAIGTVAVSEARPLSLEKVRAYFSLPHLLVSGNGRCMLLFSTAVLLSIDLLVSRNGGCISFFSTAVLLSIDLVVSVKDGCISFLPTGVIICD